MASMVRMKLHCAVKKNNLTIVCVKLSVNVKINEVVFDCFLPII